MSPGCVAIAVGGIKVKTFSFKTMNGLLSEKTEAQKQHKHKEGGAAANASVTDSLLKSNKLSQENKMEKQNQNI